MTRDEAQAVLYEMGAHASEDEPGRMSMGGDDPFFGVAVPYFMGACLDGDFSADQLEAIAVWMREPFAFDRKPDTDDE